MSVLGSQVFGQALMESCEGRAGLIRSAPRPIGWEGGD